MHGQPKPELTPEEKLKNLETDLTKLSKDIQRTIGHSYESKERVKPRYLNKYEEQETARKLKDLRNKAVADLDEKFIQDEKTQGPILENIRKIFDDLDSKLNKQFANFIEMGDSYDFQSRVKNVDDAQLKLETEINKLIQSRANELKDSKNKIDSDFKKETERLIELDRALKKTISDIKNTEASIQEKKKKGDTTVLLNIKLEELRDAETENRKAIDNFIKPYSSVNDKLKNLENKKDADISAKDREQTKYKNEAEDFIKAKRSELEYFKKTDEFQKEVDKLKQSVADQYHLAYVRSHRKDTGDEWIPVKGDAKAAYDAAHGKEAIALGADPKELISKPGTYYHKDGRWSWHIVLDDKGFVTTAPVLTENDNREENYKARIHFIAKQAGAKSMFIQYKKVSGYIDVGMLEFLCKEAWSHGMTISNFHEIMNEVDKADPPIPADKHRAIKILQDKNEEEEKAQAGKDQAAEDIGKTFREEAKLHNAIESLESNKANRIAENKNSELENEDIEELKSAPPEPPDDAKVIDYGKLYVYKSSDEKRAGIEFCYKTLSGEVKKIRPEDLNDDLKLNDQKFPLSDENREIIINSKFFKDLSETKKGDSYLTSIEAKATKSMDKLKNYEAEVDKLTAQAARLEKGINVLSEQVGGVGKIMRHIDEGKDPYDNKDEVKKGMDSLNNQYEKLHQKWMDLRSENQKELGDLLRKQKALKDKLKELAISDEKKEQKGQRSPFVGEEKEKTKFESRLKQLQNKLDDMSVTINNEGKNVPVKLSQEEKQNQITTILKDISDRGIDNFKERHAELEKHLVGQKRMDEPQRRSSLS